MLPTLSFRPLSRCDFALIARWLGSPHVAGWWGESAERVDIAERYGPRVDGLEPTHVFVIEYEGLPIGWIQWYRWADYPLHALQLEAGSGSAGIDLAIGELAMTGRGLGPVVICEFLREIVFAASDVTAVIADPEEGNTRSLRAFEKAGFRIMKTVQLEGETSKRRVVRMDR